MTHKNKPKSSQVKTAQPNFFSHPLMMWMTLPALAACLYSQSFIFLAVCSVQIPICLKKIEMIRVHLESNPDREVVLNLIINIVLGMSII